MKYIATVLSCLLLITSLKAQEQKVFLHESFSNTNKWKPLLFPKIPEHSSYDIVQEGTNSILRAKSNSSASGLIYNTSFNVSKHPKVKWRWKTENVFQAGDAKSKSGDDYPIRIYIIFEYQPSKASFGLRTKYALAKKIYGEYPPHSSLNYIWANKPHKESIIVSPYTSRSVMIPLQAGTGNIGKWVTEEIDIVSDYKTAFGTEPPETASLAIMSDSDNTGETSISYIDFITVFR